MIRNPELKSKELKTRVKVELKVDISTTMCKRVKRAIFRELAGNYIVEYRKLWDYANELRLLNPSSTVVVEAEHGADKFSCFYVCFKERLVS